MVMFQHFISIPDCHDNQHNRTLHDSSSSVSDKTKYFQILVALTGHFTFKVSRNVQEQLHLYIFPMILGCLLHFYCAFASFLSLKASDLIYCNCNQYFLNLSSLEEKVIQVQNDTSKSLNFHFWTNYSFESSKLFLNNKNNSQNKYFFPIKIQRFWLKVT